MSVLRLLTDFYLISMSNTLNILISLIPLYREKPALNMRLFPNVSRLMETSDYFYRVLQ